MPKRIILDTDIGSDIDDAFALALAVSSPELELVGVTTVHGAVEKRARIARKLLNQAGAAEVPVIPGFRGCGNPDEDFAQASWAEGTGLQPPAQAAVDFIVQELEATPGEITIVAIGALSNIAQCIDEESVVVEKMAEVVIMGGSVYAGYAGASPPEPEYNIACDPEAARKVFESGVKLTVVPLDATATLALPDEYILALESSDAALAHAVTQLMRLWQGGGRAHPVLHDPLAVTAAFDRSIGRFERLRLQVTGDGLTVPVAGPPNATVCLGADAKRLFDLVIGRIAGREAP
jgi:purine nucleosidase